MIYSISHCWSFFTIFFFSKLFMSFELTITVIYSFVFYLFIFFIVIIFLFLTMRNFLKLCILSQTIKISWQLLFFLIVYFNSICRFWLERTNFGLFLEKTVSDRSILYCSLHLQKFLPLITTLVYKLFLSIYC